MKILPSFISFQTINTIVTRSFGLLRKVYDLAKKLFTKKEEGLHTHTNSLNGEIEIKNLNNSDENLVDLANRIENTKEKDNNQDLLNQEPLESDSVDQTTIEIEKEIEETEVEEVAYNNPMITDTEYLRISSLKDLDDVSFRQEFLRLTKAIRNRSE